MIDPKLDAFLDLFVEIQKKCQTMTLPEARKYLDDFVISIPVPIVEVHQIQDLKVDQIPVRMYVPEGKAPFGAIVYFHGGGWVFGSTKKSDSFCRALCKKTGFCVLSADYRLAPEAHFPKGLDDCYKVVRWVKEKAVSLGIDPTKIGVAGTSAGGNLAAAVALMAKDTEEFDLAFELLFFPVLTSFMDKKAYEASLDQRFITFEGMASFWSLYLARPEDGDHPYASPLKSESFEKLPPTLILVAEHDPLTADGKAYDEALRKYGVKTVFKFYPGMFHDFINMPLDLPSTQIALSDMADFLECTVSNSKPESPAN